MTDEQLSILSPKNDFVFKQLFGDAENIEPLRAFLQAALGFPEEEFAELTIADPNLNARFDGDKHCILDVRVKTKSGRAVDVEIQVKPTLEIYNRLQRYTARMVSEQVKAGEGYGDMPQSITIVIADFVLWKGYPRYHHRFQLYEAEAGFAYPNSLEIHTLELSKLPESSDGTKLWDWLKFMSSETPDEFEALARKDAVMAKTIVKLLDISSDEAKRWREDSEGKWRWDRNAWIREGKAEAREEARQEKLNIARQLLDIPLSVAAIAKMTGFPEEEIIALAQDKPHG